MSSEHPWFAVHDEILYDPKLARIKRATGLPRMIVLGAWATVLALSNQSPVRGVLLIREDRPLRDQELFDEWELPTNEAACLLNGMCDMGLLHQENGAWVVSSWEKRQPRMDKSTERVREWRAKQKAAATSKNPVTLHETNETFQVTLPETKSNGTEKEREKEKEREGEGGGAAADLEFPSGDDEYSLERRMDVIIRDGLDAHVGNRRLPDGDDDAANQLWGDLLRLCQDDEAHAAAIIRASRGIADELDWVFPFPKSDYECRVAMTDWWRPVKKALAVRQWDQIATVKAMVAAANAMHHRNLSPGKPAALMGELSKQKARASPNGAAGQTNGHKSAVRSAVRERLLKGDHDE